MSIVDNFKRQIYEAGYADGKRDAVVHGHWIPISERMPKREEMVLVCFRWSGFEEQFDIGYIDKDPDNLQLRWNFEDFDLYGDEMDAVVAWMPLPEPYKMNEVMR